MLIYDCLPTDELFSHEDLHGATRHFNASAMTRAVLANTVTPVFETLALYDDLVAHIEKFHGVEEPHLANLGSSINNPIIVVEFPDGDNLVVDGNHRVVKRWRLGLKTVPAAIFKPGQWEPFLVTGVDIPREIYVPKGLTTCNE